MPQYLSQETSHSLPILKKKICGQKTKDKKRTQVIHSVGTKSTDILLVLAPVTTDHALPPPHSYFSSCESGEYDMIFIISHSTQDHFPSPHTSFLIANKAPLPPPPPHSRARSRSLPLKLQKFAFQLQIRSRCRNKEGTQSCGHFEVVGAG